MNHIDKYKAVAIEYDYKQFIIEQYGASHFEGISALQTFPNHSRHVEGQQFTSVNRNATAEAASAILWQKALSGSNNDYAYYLTELFDGSIAVARSTRSNNSDIKKQSRRQRRLGGKI